MRNWGFGMLIVGLIVIAAVGAVKRSMGPTWSSSRGMGQFDSERQAQSTRYRSR